MSYPPPYPPQDQQGYPLQGQQGYPPQEQQGYPPQDHQEYPRAQGQQPYPPPSQQGYPPEPYEATEPSAAQVEPGRGYAAPQQTVYQQPAAQAPMMTTGAYNSNPLSKPVDDKGQRKWNHGLCDCFSDCGTCCLSIWCPCIVYGRNRSRLNHLKNLGRPHPTGGEDCGTDSIVYCLLLSFTGLYFILQLPNRTETRERYNISGSSFGDCCISCWCQCSDLVQVHREIQDEENSIRGGSVQKA